MDGFESATPCAERSIIVIPALDPAPALPGYVEALLDEGFPHIIVVNDGSGPQSARVFAALAATPGCLVLNHEVNRGKGAAIKTALRHCLQMRWQCRYGRAIMVDADGQHAVEDVRRMAEASEAHPAHYVLGVRDFAQAGVPPRSRFGNRLTSGAFLLLYGRYLGDTQTGLRAIPASLWPWAAGVAGERFEYETDCLIQAVKTGIPMAEVKIRTLYFDHNAGTHYHTVRDSWPILRVMLRNLGSHALIGALSWITELFAFCLLDQRIFSQMAPFGRIPAAAVGAWGTAWCLHQLLGRLPAGRGVRRPGRAAALPSRPLAALQLAAACLLILAIHSASGWPAVWIKAAVDPVLGLVTYAVQLRRAVQENSTE